MRIAVIDLGTNTFNLLVRDTLDHEEVHAMKIPVKLGQGGILKKQISKEAMDRGMQALKKYSQITKALDVDQVYAFGTSALRDAENRDEFTSAVKQAYGLHVNVISGSEEAELIFEGVKYGIDLSKGTNLIMDIGGGSTEFILTENNAIIWSESFQIGSSRLADQFKVSDPVKPEEILEINEFLDQALNNLWTAIKSHPVDQLIGSSGSFETLAQVCLAQRGQGNETPSNGFEVSLDEYQQVIKYILESSLKERLNDPAIINMRADMIVLAAILLHRTIEKLHINQIKLSNFALKEGVFSKLTANKLTWQKS